ncbi:hypothetical protein LPTSP2_36730 [Leptospira ellinghausenii]|uniref:DUF4325 domain-containing protein n=1 Tax=Leptospira ellinghausenii TaxID=1917822 RepID=A0A2P2DIH7_9LEPT|nr:STAS-like domain-containing protein [Leptospira ellinghausenii]GBF44370.1 hypothetical protein LPTSP2_36730 [Leptospira ellinghausenii]
MNETVRLSFSGTDLSSRTYGQEQRLILEKLLQNGDKVTIDLRNIESISHSFADELFAVLYSKVGEKTFSEKINFIVKSEDLVQVISDSIRYRCNLQSV